MTDRDALGRDALGRDALNRARFSPGMRGGHYESFYQRANHPTRPLAFWLRYTVFSPRGRPQDAVGELWGVVFDGDRGEHTVAKRELPISECRFDPDRFAVRVGDSTLAPGHLAGAVGDLGWDLRYHTSQEPLFLLPQRLYRGGFPKAKSLVAYPGARFEGELRVEGQRIDVSDWVGSQNHNWGSAHTDRYAFGQVAGFDEAPESFLEVATAQAKLPGGVRTPWLTFLVLRHGGREHALVSLRQALRARAEYTYFTWTFRSEDERVRVAGTITAPAAAFVGLRYGNPPGGAKHCLNTKIAACDLTVTDKSTGTAQRLRTGNRALFEILTDEPRTGDQARRATDRRARSRDPRLTWQGEGQADAMSIAVTGATGALGGLVARRLAERGLPQRLVVRDPARAPRLDRAQVVTGAYDRPGFDEALRGIDTLLLVSMSEAPDRVGPHTAAIDAAVTAGVSHIVYTSFLGAAPQATFTFARDHWHTEEHLRRTGVAYTILRDNLYLDVLPYFPDDEGVLRGPAGDGRTGAVARDDIADAAVGVLTDPGRFAGKSFDLTGPDSLSLADIADELTRAAGRPVRYHAETLAEAYASRAHYGAPEWEVAGWVTSYTAIAAGELDVVSDAVLELAGHPPMSFAEFLRRNPSSLDRLRAG